MNDGADNVPLRVLLVEDDEDDYVIIRYLLAEIEEFDLEWVTDYGDALEAIAREEHDVCLLDYRLGERSGLELLREASARGYGIPMILLTGQGSREVDLQAMEAGAADYLIKGRIDAHLLERAIRYAFARTLKALGESERRFRSLVQNASDVVAILEGDGTVRYESPSIERALGYKPEELVGKSLVEYMHPGDVGWVRSKLANLLEQPDEPSAMWYRVRHKDGSWRWFESIGSNLLHDPAVKGIVVNSRDITERKRAEEALKDSEELYRSVVEQAAENIFLVDVETKRILEANAALSRSLGYPLEELQEMTLYDIVADDKGNIDHNIELIVEKGQHSPGERCYRCKDGSLVDVEVDVSLIPYGGRDAMCVVAHDVTERKRAEEQIQSTLASLLALHEAGQILNSTLEREEIGSWLLEILQRISGPDAAVIDLKDRQGRLCLWRTTGPEDLWRPARSTPEARTARRKVLGSGHRQLFRLPRPNSTDGAQLVGLYLPLRMRDQLIGIVEVYGPEALAEEGTVETIASLVGQASSALENARLYAELAERERALQDLVGKLLGAQEEERRRVAYEVHDGLAQTAVAAHQLLQAYARHHAPGAAESQKNLDRVLQLVQQTVGEARDIIADLRPTVLDDFGLATAIRQQVERLGGEERRIDYEETLGGERLPAVVETALYRVAQEALTNVRKHASSARTELTLHRLDRSVRLRVRDWGRGFRTDEVTNGGGPGERVGLSSMRERVVLLGGSLKLHSEPGYGTEVVAEVPLPAEDAEHE